MGLANQKILKTLACSAYRQRGRQHANFMIKSLGAVLVFGSTYEVKAAVVSPCAGVSLAPSVITNIVGDAVLPITSVLDNSLLLLLGPLGLNSNLNTTLEGIAAGDPINLNVLDENGNVVSPANQCDASADSFTLDNPQGISIGGNQITGLGNGLEAQAGEINSIAFGNNAVTDAAALNSIAIGTDANIGSLGADSVAIGSGANVNVGNSVAIGTDSTATVGAQTNYSAYALTTPQNSVGEVSMGAAGATRTITNVSAGSSATDAVNVSQLQAVNDGAVKYDLNTPQLRMTVTLGGALSTDGGVTNGTRITNLSQGEISADSTDAVNGAQLFNITYGFTTNIDALGLSTATNLGGGAIYNPTTGIISAPVYNVYGTIQNNVGDAINALQSESPIQYSDVNGVATPGVKSNDVTLVGSTSDPVRIHNVAAGIASTDAVNVGQLNALATNVGNLDALAVKYDQASKDIITLAGPTSLDGGLTGGTLITNLQQGDISEFSTDAMNGAQMYETRQLIANISNGTGIKYFKVKSSLSDALATGVDSMAIGPQAQSTGIASIAMGLNSQATNDGAIAFGLNSLSSGINSIAIGTGAIATGSVAVGAGAQAGNGGAAFGDNAIALTPQQGTAIGNAAIVTANRGVALGAGSTATRAGMNGATERFSNIAVTSTEGAVSVGSAGNERQITNVAGGTEDTDAVNVRQLEAAISQSGFDISNQLNALRSDISTVRHDANAGTAAAMALASMPQSVMPGKAMLAAGIGHYEGQSAMSIGVSNFSENGRWVVNVNGSANTRGKAGAGIGVGFHW